MDPATGEGSQCAKFGILVEVQVLWSRRFWFGSRVEAVDRGGVLACFRHSFRCVLLRIDLRFAATH